MILNNNKSPFQNVRSVLKVRDPKKKQLKIPRQCRSAGPRVAASKQMPYLDECVTREGISPTRSPRSSVKLVFILPESNVGPYIKRCKVYAIRYEWWNTGIWQYLKFRTFLAFIDKLSRLNLRDPIFLIGPDESQDQGLAETCRPMHKFGTDCSLNSTYPACS